jgi:integrase
MPDHLILRSGVYYFHRRVPSKLTPLIGKPFWRESLGTRDEAEAKKKVVMLNGDCEQMITIAEAEYRRQRSAVARLTRDEREVVEAAGGLNALRRTTVGDVNTNHPARMGLRGEVRLAEAASGMLASETKAGRAELAAEGIDLDELREQVAEAEARAVVLRERLKRNLEILRKGSQAPDPELSDDADSTPETITLKDVHRRWADESKAPVQHVNQYEYAVKRFHELHNRSLPLTEITKSHLRQFKDAISKLPRSTRADLRKATLARAISIADKEGLARIDERTTRKHILALSTLLNHAVGWGYLESSPAQGLRFVKPRGKVSDESRRLGFSPNQLRELDASLSQEYKITADDRWTPILCAYQGCRLEEACQMLKGDIREQADGTWVMRITDEHETQKVKNRSSVRTLPIHQALIDRGFLEHVKRSPGPLVFASLKPDKRGRLGGPYSKRFARHLRRRAKITDPNLSFHSLRHAWKTAARNAEMPEEVQAAIMGHTQGSVVASRYGGQQAAVVLSKFLNRVDPFAEPGNGTL